MHSTGQLSCVAGCRKPGAFRSDKISSTGTILNKRTSRVLKWPLLEFIPSMEPDNGTGYVWSHTICNRRSPLTKPKSDILGSDLCVYDILTLGLQDEYFK